MDRRRIRTCRQKAQGLVQEVSHLEATEDAPCLKQQCGTNVSGTMRVRDSKARWSSAANKVVSKARKVCCSSSIPVSIPNIP